MKATTSSSRAGKLRKVERIGPDKVRFERDVKRLVRRPDVVQAVLMVRTWAPDRDVKFAHLGEGYMSDDLALIEHGKAIILHEMSKDW